MDELLDNGYPLENNNIHSLDSVKKMKREGKTKTKTRVKCCLTYLLLAYTMIVALGFVLLYLVGFFVFGFTGENGDWSCYATQDNDVKLPWNVAATGESAPDSYHDVSANF